MAMIAVYVVLYVLVVIVVAMVLWVMEVERERVTACVEAGNPGVGMPAVGAVRQRGEGDMGTRQTTERPLLARED